MRKVTKSIVFLIGFAILALSIPSHASSVPDGCELLRCTCYTPTGNKTADGTIPYEGICASNREHLGQVAVVWTQDGEFCGIFECRDTGSHEGLQNGTRIDIFRNDMQGVREWQQTVGDYVIILWVEGEG